MKIKTVERQPKPGRKVNPTAADTGHATIDEADEEPAEESASASATGSGGLAPPLGGTGPAAAPVMPPPGAPRPPPTPPEQPSASEDEAASQVASEEATESAAVSGESEPAKREKGPRLLPWRKLDGGDDTEVHQRRKAAQESHGSGS